MKTHARATAADRRSCRACALGGELREMAVARWELARLELQADLRSAKRLAIAWLAAAVMALTVAAAAGRLPGRCLDGCGQISRGGWLLIFAGGLLVLAVAGGLLAWRRFRRRFVGLQETLEELREDLVWLREKGEGRERMTKGTNDRNPMKLDAFASHSVTSRFVIRILFSTSPPRSPGESSRASGRRALPGR